VLNKYICFEEFFLNWTISVEKLNSVAVLISLVKQQILWLAQNSVGCRELRSLLITGQHAVWASNRSTKAMNHSCTITTINTVIITSAKEVT